MATYVYAVCGADVVLPPGLEGLGGNLRPIADEALVAVAGDAPDEPIRPTRRNLLAHQEILQGLRAAAVLPMRFGHVFPDDSSVRGALLSPHAARLLAMLRRGEGRVQRNVKLRYDDDALLARAVDLAPDLAAGLRRLRAGQALNDRIALGEIAARAIDLACAEDERHLLVALRPHCADVEVLAHGSHLTPFRGAFLVGRDACESFEKALSEAAAGMPGDVNVECIGPLPAHAFAQWEAGEC